MGEDIIKDLGGTLYLYNNNTGEYEPLVTNFTSIAETSEDLLKPKAAHQGMIKWNFYVERVIYNKPATIVFFTDGSKTVVKASKGDPFDPEKGLALAIIKRSFNNDSTLFHKFLRKWKDETEDKEKRK